jgi:hypothetical protein
MLMKMAIMKPLTEQDVTNRMAVSVIAMRRLTTTGMGSRFMSDQQWRDNLDGVKEEEKGVLSKWS